MKLTGRLIKNTAIIKEAVIEKDDETASYTDLLEECLIGLCRELDIQVPLWLKKNTAEFVKYHRTFFTKEQFMENVRFERFEIKLEL